MKYLFGNIIQIVFYILNVLILIRILLSWVPFDRSNKYIKMLFTVTDPILEPCKSLIQRVGINMGMIDISPIVAFLLLQLLEKILLFLVYSIF